MPPWQEYQKLISKIDKTFVLSKYTLKECVYTYYAVFPKAPKICQMLLTRPNPYRQSSLLPVHKFLFFIRKVHIFCIPTFHYCSVRPITSIVIKYKQHHTIVEQLK